MSTIACTFSGTTASITSVERWYCTGSGMKITDVQVIVLESPDAYGASGSGDEAHGIKYLGLVKIETDAGITGYADLETQPHVAKAVGGR